LHNFAFFALSLHIFAFFALSLHFSHILSHFLLLFGALTVKHGAKSAKIRKKCKKCDANAKCECNAKAVRCDAMGLPKVQMQMRITFRTTIPGLRHM
jgi:hypothetical protein